ncbi:uncharacterized protein Z518_05609 [Rhinocladiella mackenziei CBS 650.93]|uniref:Alpha/beta hydrolase fold-3 domain-containing protein n=1 Tax=Rhinocladiella mackenziei CBS 650.93 TaxID=1442369 RepID=A0A0D2IG10_9EURO|nr:uncharacterized protein Z518_05609 [Rhinocladiella mackenziei CBS 650.93]KIX04739.1 hypothetical protein Z518_05609 [Rhinocladiella mackenziei CBS 650.93]
MDSYSLDNRACRSPRTRGTSAIREYFGLTGYGTNMIECADDNFFEELGRLNINWNKIPPGTDVERMRHWISTDYTAIPKTSFLHRHIRERVPIEQQDVKVCYGETFDFTMRIYTPLRGRCQPRPAVIMYHGGGWIHGDATSDEDFALLFASELDALIVSVNYSLAPENPYPRPHEDCYEALNWVMSNAERLGINPARIALWGCSAGANLAAGVALRDSEEHAPTRIRQIHLVVPATCSPEVHEGPLKKVYEAQEGVAKWELSLGDVATLMRYYAPQNLTHPFVSPMHSHPSANHPATHITVAGLDVLRDQGIAYALHLRNCFNAPQISPQSGSNYHAPCSRCARLGKPCIYEKAHRSNIQSSRQDSVHSIDVHDELRETSSTFQDDHIISQEANRQHCENEFSSTNSVGLENLFDIVADEPVNWLEPRLEAEQSINDGLDWPSIIDFSLEMTGNNTMQSITPSVMPSTSLHQKYGHDVEKFLQDTYVILPVVDKGQLWDQILTNGTDHGLRTLLEAIRMVNLGTLFRKTPKKETEDALVAQVKHVETLRSEEDFSESPNLDTVAVSLFLFCMYNVLWRHNRAFLYLGEACDLFGLVSQNLEEDGASDIRLLRRLARLDLVLFNTEVATYSLYSKASHRRRKRACESGAALIRGDRGEDTLERVADDLLLHLTEIHEISNSDLDVTRNNQDDHDGYEPIDLSCFAEEQSSPSIRMQTADVIISDHWRALESLVTETDNVSTSAVIPLISLREASRRLTEMVCHRASATLACICALDEGSLRVIGLGKLTSIVKSIKHLTMERRRRAEPTQCKNLMSGLVLTIAKADYERNFVAELSGCIDLIKSTGLYSGPRFVSRKGRGLAKHDENSDTGHRYPMSLGSDVVEG